MSDPTKRGVISVPDLPEAHLSDRFWEQIIEQAAAALQPSTSPPLNPGTMPSTPKELVDVLCMDQLTRWSAGDRVLAEDYFAKHPLLEAHPDEAFELVYGEFAVREALGDAPKVDEYIKRFPRYAERLQRQLAVHEAMDHGIKAGSKTNQTPPTSPSGNKPISVLQPPGYELIRELGRGGMGLVYEARQTGLNRTVALKVIRSMKVQPEELGRFHTEAQSTARLKHPNIVQIYDVGEHEGRPYFSMEYLDGGTLRDRMGVVPWPPRAAAALVETIARAVHFAHQNGVIHRDLKPANILLCAKPQTQGAPATGSHLLDVESLTPKISDFGLAKLLDADSGLTKTGQVIGTPAYMAPEQAAARRKAIGPATDVYALGVILYELLSARKPFYGDTPMHLLRNVEFQEPPPLLTVRRDVPPDLAAICHRCLQKEPPNRYPSAEALAESLHSFLARSQRSWSGSWWTWGLVGVVVLAILLAIGAGEVARRAGLTVTYVNHNRSVMEQAGQERDQELARAKQAEDQSEQVRRHAEAALIDAATDLALAADERGDSALALLWHARAVQRSHDSKDMIREELNRTRVHVALGRILRPVQAFQTRSVESEETVVALRPRGRQLLLLFVDGQCEFWDLDQGAPLPLPRLPDPVLSVAWASNGNQFALGCRNGTVMIVDYPSGAVTGRLEYGEPVTALAFSADGHKLACGGKTARVYDTQSHTATTGPFPHPQPVRSVTFNSHGDQLLTSCADHHARLFGLTGSNSEQPLLPPIPHLSTTRISPLYCDRDRGLLTITPEGKLAWWNASDGRLLRTLATTGTPTQVSISPDGQYLAVADQAGVARLWNLSTAVQIGPNLEHPGTVSQVRFSPDGERLVTVCIDGSVRCWPLSDGHTSPMPLRHQRLIAWSAFLPDGDGLLLTLQEDGLARIWAFPDLGRPGVSLVAPMSNDDPARALPKLPASAVLSRDGRYAAILTAAHLPAQAAALEQTSRGRAGSVTLWDRRAGKMVHSPAVMPSDPEMALFHPDGHRLTVFCAGGQLVVLDAATAKPVKQWERQGTRRGTTDAADRANACFSPDGSLLAGWGSGASLHVWETQSGMLRFALPEGERVTAAAFSPDGQFLALSKPGPTAHIWELSNGQVAGKTLVHPDDVLTVRFHPTDGHRLVTACRDGAVRIWEWSTGALVGRPLIHDGPVADAGFLPDGDRIGTVGRDGAVRIWEWQTGRLLCPALRPEGGAHAVALATGFRFLCTSSDGPALRELEGSRLAPYGDLDASAVGSLAELVAGRRLDDSGTALSLSTPVWLKSWTAFRAQTAIGPFLPTVEDIGAWHRRRAAQCEQAGHVSAALFHLTKLLVIHPDDAEALRHRGRARLSLPGAESEALADFTRLAQLHADDAVAYAGKGDVELKLGHWAEATTNYDRAIQLAPNQGELWLSRGRAFLHQGEIKAAAVNTLRAHELGVDNPESWRRLALTQLAQSDLKEYWSACNQALQRFGPACDARCAYQLCRACAVSTSSEVEPARLIELAERALAENPRDPDRLTQLGAALFRAGQLDKAADRLVEAKRLRADNPITLFWLAMTQQGQGQSEAARASLAQAIDLLKQAPATGIEVEEVPLMQLEGRVLRREAEAMLNRKGARGSTISPAVARAGG